MMLCCLCFVYKPLNDPFPTQVHVGNQMGVPLQMLVLAVQGA